MADRRFVEVSGLPSHPYDDDFIKDQLLLYFLRTKNGGGCEVSVHYPTAEDGVALLTFEDEKVAKRILNRKHTLVIDDCTHPLEVRRPQPHSSQFSLTIKTSLDLSYFSNVPEVKRLLERNRLCIYHENSSIISIKGDFCDLRRCRLDLYKLIYRHNPREKQYSSQEPTASKHLHSEEKGRRTPQNVTTTPDQESPSSSNLSRRRPEGRGHLAQDNVTRDHKNNLGSPTQHSSPETVPHGSSTRARAPTPTRVQRVSTLKSLCHSFPVNTAVYTYVRTFRQDGIDSVLRQYNIDMSAKNNKGFTSIILTSLSPVQPESFQDVCDKIKKIFDYFHSLLRAENIELPTNSRFSNEEISKKIQGYLFDLKICSLPVANNSLDIIGPSENILMFLQDWKGTRGKFAQNMLEGSGFPRSPTVGMDSKNLATKSNNSTQARASDGRSRRHEAGYEAHVRGKEQQQNEAGSGRAKPSANHTRPSWK